MVKDIKKETKYKRKNAQFIKSQQIFLEWKNRYKLSDSQLENHLLPYIQIKIDELESYSIKYFLKSVIPSTIVSIPIAFLAFLFTLSLKDTDSWKDGIGAVMNMIFSAYGMIALVLFLVGIIMYKGILFVHYKFTFEFSDRVYYKLIQTIIYDHLIKIKFNYSEITRLNK